MQASQDGRGLCDGMAGSPCIAPGKAVGSLEEGALTCEDGSITDQDEPREEIPLHLDV